MNTAAGANPDNKLKQDSPYKLAFASFNNKEGYELNTNASSGFIEIYSLQMKIANETKPEVQKAV